MDGQDAEITMAFGGGPIGLRLTLLDVKSNNFVENLQRRRQLQKGSLVLLRVNEQASCIGRVVRPFKEPNDLNPDAYREIGIAVDSSAFITLLASNARCTWLGLRGLSLRTNLYSVACNLFSAALSPGAPPRG